MGLFAKLKGELIDIIEWTDDSSDTMLYRFERYGNEIKNGAQLIVRESQMAVLINMGQLADIYQPGMYTLETKNMPILSTLQGWKHGFESPFKAEVYFISTKQFTDLKWGTQNPVMMRDPEFGPIRLRARGNFSIRIEDAGHFIKELAGTDGHFTTDEMMGQLRTLIVSRFTDALGEMNIPALDLAANYDEFGTMMESKLREEFKSYGLSLMKILVSNIMLPDAVNEAMDKRSSMGIVGNLNQYSQFQAANAMEQAANNPSGTAAGGMGMGMGFAMANQMAQGFNQQGNNQQNSPTQGSSASPVAPPPIPGSRFFVAVNGQQTGPFDMNSLQTKINSGEITAQTMLWKQGMAAWAAAGQIADFNGKFAPPPPPM